MFKNAEKKEIINFLFYLSFFEKKFKIVSPAC